MALGLALFAGGLGGTSILASYLGPFAGVAASLSIGCVAASVVLGWRSLLASIPAAAFVLAFMSAENTGAIVAVVIALAVVAHAKFSPLAKAA